jgi:hypothetical protein
VYDLHASCDNNLAIFDALLTENKYGSYGIIYDEERLQELSPFNPKPSSFREARHLCPAAYSQKGNNNMQKLTTLLVTTFLYSSIY